MSENVSELTPSPNSSPTPSAHKVASRRCGVLTQKVGMTRWFAEDGRHCPVSMLRLEGARVLDAATSPAPDGLFRVRVAAGEQKPQRLSKPMRGVFAKAECPTMRKIVSFPVSKDCLPPPSAEFSVLHFAKGQFVDATALSIGKGFAGAMKRYGFKGLRATHGVSVSHRSMGSTGNREYPGKVFKGKKMPGRMGGKRVTIENLQILALDEEKDLIFVKGAIPGAKGGWVTLRDAGKKALPSEAPKPAGTKAGIKESSKDASPSDDKSDSTSVETSGETSQGEGGDS